MVTAGDSMATPSGQEPDWVSKYKTYGEDNALVTKLLQSLEGEEVDVNITELGSNGRFVLISNQRVFTR